MPVASVKKPELKNDELFNALPSAQAFHIGSPSFLNILNNVNPDGDVIAPYYTNLAFASAHPFEELHADISTLYGFTSKITDEIHAEDLKSSIASLNSIYFNTKPESIASFALDYPINTKPISELTSSILTTIASQPSSFFLDTKITAEDLFKTPSTLSINSLYNDRLELDIPSLLFSKSPEEKRIEALESKIEKQQMEIQQLKITLKTEQKRKRSKDVEINGLKKLLKYKKAFSYIEAIQEEIERTEAVIEQESKSKAEYTMYG
jgi:hypothetical protein